MNKTHCLELLVAFNRALSDIRFVAFDQHYLVNGIRATLQNLETDQQYELIIRPLDKMDKKIEINDKGEE